MADVRPRASTKTTLKIIDALLSRPIILDSSASVSVTPGCVNGGSMGPVAPNA